MVNFKEIAEDYLMAGLNPLPLRENKAPNLPKGHNLLYQENTDLNRFAHPETFKIGVACGAVSGNLYCIDFDAKDGEPIKEIFKKYTDCDQFRLLMKMRLICVVRTISGGYHLIFRTENPEKTTDFARWENGKVMIESRGNGSYIATYPSQGYEHIKGVDITELTTPLDDIQLDFLVTRARSFNRDMSYVKRVTGSAVADKERKWPEKWDNETPEGRYNNECQGEVIPLLKSIGWQVAYTDGNLTALTRPGKDVKDGISATFNYRPGMLSVFSRNAEPFVKDFTPEVDKNINYTPFAVFTKIRHKGDWKAAKEDLRERFGMDKETKLEERYKYIRPKAPDAMDFPIDAFDPDWQQFLMAMDKTLNFAPEYVACSMISAVSTLIGNRVKLQVKEGYEASLIFWFVCVGSPGTTKSHPVKKVLEPIDEINYSRFQVYEKEYTNWEALDPDEKRKHPQPMFEQLVINDATVEAVAQVLNFAPNGVLYYKDEIVGFFKSMNQYRKGADEEFWLSSFDNGSRQINRKTQKTIYLRKIFVNIIGTIQDAILNTLTKDFKENGFLDRFLFTKSINRVLPISDEDLDHSFITWWTDYIKFVNRVFVNFSKDEPLIVKMTAEGWEAFKETDAQFVKMVTSEDIDEGVKNSLSKVRTYLPRFALLFAIVEHFATGVELEVTPKEIRQAKRLLDYFFSTNRQIFSSQVLNDEVSQWISKNSGLTIAERILALKDRFDLKQVEIAKYLNTKASYVSRVLKDVKK
jgi:hypothetical protein